MKNESINILKSLAAMLVVCIHCPFPGIFGEIVLNIGRIAVPIFLLISGFYSYNNTKEKVKKKIRNILKLIIISNIIYLLYLIYYKGINNMNGYIKWLFNVKTLGKIIVFNENPFRTHLWYLSAILYCYIIYYLYITYIKERINKINIISKYFAIILLILNFVITSLYINHSQENKMFVIRNFIFIGLPFFIIGNIINRNKIFEKISNKKIYLCAIISVLFVFVEFNLYLSELYIGNIFLAISIFVFCIKNPNFFKMKYIEKIGEKYSLYIYILHPLLKDILNYIYKILKINYIFMISIKPIILIIMSIFMSILIVNMEKLRKHRRYITKG